MALHKYPFEHLLNVDFEVPENGSAIIEKDTDQQQIFLIFLVAIDYRI